MPPYIILKNENFYYNIYEYICYLNYLHCKKKRGKIIESKIWKYHLNNNYLFLPKDMYILFKIDVSKL